jgi:hypothetical protein
MGERCIPGIDMAVQFLGIPGAREERCGVGGMHAGTHEQELGITGERAQV